MAVTVDHPICQRIIEAFAVQGMNVAIPPPGPGSIAGWVRMCVELILADDARHQDHERTRANLGDLQHVVLELIADGATDPREAAAIALNFGRTPR